MAISKGQQSTEAVEKKLYMGVGAVKILAVNPTKSELEKIYNREIDNEPVYVQNSEINGVTVPSVRVSFVVSTPAEKNNGIEVISSHNFFIRKEVRKGSQSGKIQVIDKYGETAWATEDDINNKRIPMYTNGPAKIDIDYRPCYTGEEDLTNFLRNYLNIPRVQAYVNGQWIQNPKAQPSDCEIRLDHIADYFNGNFAELKEITSYQPENLVKILFGVRTTDDGKTYQTTYTQMSMKNSQSDYSKFEKDVNERKANGAMATTSFDYLPLHEYIVTPTDFSNQTPNTDDTPF